MVRVLPPPEGEARAAEVKFVHHFPLLLKTLVQDSASEW